MIPRTAPRHAKITTAAYASKIPTIARRRATGSAPITRAGPTRCGSSDGERPMRITNTTKIEMRITASKIVSVCLNGNVSE